MEDIAKTLSVYFDLADQPDAASLMRGETTIQSYLDEIIKRHRHRILFMEKKLQQPNLHSRMKMHVEDRLHQESRKLEKAQKLQENL